MSLSLPSGCVPISHPCDFNLKYAAKLTILPGAAGVVHYFRPNPWTGTVLAMTGIRSAGQLAYDSYNCLTTKEPRLMSCESLSSTPYTDSVMEQICRPIEVGSREAKLQSPDPGICDNPVKNPFTRPTPVVQHKVEVKKTRVTKPRPTLSKQPKTTSKSNAFHTHIAPFPIKKEVKKQVSKKRSPNLQLSNSTHVTARNQSHPKSRRANFKITIR